MKHLFLLIIFFCFSFLGYCQSNNPVLTLNTEMHTASIQRISTDSLGQIILTCGTDKTAKLWDASSGKLIQTFRIPIGEEFEGKLYACALSPDGRIAALGGWTGYTWDSSYSIYLFDVASNTMKRRLKGISNLITDLEFSPNGAFLAAGLSGYGGVNIFETSAWILEKKLKDYKGECYSVTFDKSGRMATVSYDGKIRLYNKNFELIKQVNTEFQQPFSMDFTPDGKYLGVCYLDATAIHVLDGKSLKTLYKPDVSDIKSSDQEFNALSFSFDGNYLLAGGNYTLYGNNVWRRQIRVWSHQGSGGDADIPAALSRVQDIKTIPDNSFVFCSASPELARLKMDGSEYFHVGSEINHYNDNNKKHFKINTDATEIGITPYGGKPLTFSIAERQLKMDSSKGERYSDNRQGIQITDWLNARSPVLPKVNWADVSFLQSGETNRSVDISSDGTQLVFGADWNIVCFNASGSEIWRVPSPGVAWCVNISGNNKVVAVAMSDGTIRWYNMIDGQLLLSLFMHPDNERWVLWTPDGHFDCSPGADELIGWHVNQGAGKEALYYPASQFYEKFYIPDLGERVLAGENILALNPAVNMKADFKLPPKVQIIKPASTFSTSDETLEIVVQANNQGGGVDEIRLFQNGKLLSGLTRGGSGATEDLDIDLSNTSKTISRTYHVTLVPGENVFRTTAFNTERTESLPDEINVTLKAPEATSNLYILSVGINNYKNPKYALNYGKPDAMAFVSALVNRSGNIFKSIQKIEVYDDQATKIGILEAFNKVIASAGPSDVFVFFYAGHGVMSEGSTNGGPQFYLVPQDVTQLYGNDQMLNSLAISANELKNLCASIKAQKQVVIFDACQSGGAVEALAMRGAAEEKAVMQLSRSAGVVVLAATGTEQYATEFQELKHGVFTYALIEGLNSCTGSKDGKITIKELEAYVNDMVPELTKKYKGTAQYPNSSSRGMDFPLGVCE